MTKLLILASLFISFFIVAFIVYLPYAIIKTKKDRKKLSEFIENIQTTLLENKLKDNQKLRVLSINHLESLHVTSMGNLAHVKLDSDQPVEEIDVSIIEKIELFINGKIVFSSNSRPRLDQISKVQDQIQKLAELDMRLILSTKDQLISEILVFEKGKNVKEDFGFDLKDQIYSSYTYILNYMALKKADSIA